jgi:hypothetical protein
MIHPRCPHCGAEYELDDSMTGRKVLCEACQGKFVIGATESVAVIPESPTQPISAVQPAPAAPPPVVVEIRRTRKGLAAVAASTLLVAGAIAAFVLLDRTLPAPPPPPVALVFAPGASSDGILHQWNFDEARDWHDSPFGPLEKAPASVPDLAGGVDLAPSGFAPTDWISGREFMALRFSDAAQLTADRDLSPSLGGTASLAFWIRTTATGGDVPATSPGLLGATGAKGVQWGWLDRRGRINLSAGETIIATSPNPLNDGEWHFVVLSRDADSGAGRVFVDGKSTTGVGGPTGVLRQPFRHLGRLEGEATPAPAFAGDLDKVTVFNRAVDVDEASAFMANHAPKAWDCRTDVSAGKVSPVQLPLARAYDVEGDALSLRGWTAPANGTLSLVEPGSLAYTPRAGFSGGDEFRVVIQDGRGGFHAASAVVTVVVETPGGGVPTLAFEELSPLTADGALMAYGGMRVPEITDWDADGRLDLLVGAGGFVWFHRNLSASGPPVFATAVRVQAGGQDIHSGDDKCPIALADMTGDKVPDLVLSDSRNQLQMYANFAPSGKPARLAAPVPVRRSDGGVFVLPDRRFDLGDWFSAGRSDLVVGTWDSRVLLYAVSGTHSGTGIPTYRDARTILSGSYNLYPRFCDLDGDGRTDLARGINWGGVKYWPDVGRDDLKRSADLSFANPQGGSENLRVIDGAIIDFADLDGDGTPDAVLGGHMRDTIQIAWGRRPSAASLIQQIDTFFTAHPDDPGVALSADNNAALERINRATRGLITLIESGSPAVREEVYAGLSALVRKHPCLTRRKLDTTRFRHVPGIAVQFAVLLTHARPDTPAHRRNVADLTGLTGVARDIYLQSRLVLGDNATLDAAQLGTVRDMMRHQPRELFPDSVITFDQFFGDGRGGFLWTPDSTKNTFGCAVGMANEWADDLTKAIEAAQGKGAAHGEYFTFVMGHEVTHSMDGYVTSRLNRDLRRRWGQVLCRAAGPDIRAGADGWPDMDATRRHFERAGRFTPPSQSWDAAWKAYWESGPGAKFRHTSFMRGGIDWFLAAPQESLATQANHHWASGPGRLIGAHARYRRGVETGNAPEKANMTEVVDFIDYLSVGPQSRGSAPHLRRGHPREARAVGPPSRRPHPRRTRPYHPHRRRRSHLSIHSGSRRHGGRCSRHGGPEKLIVR